MRSRTTYIDFIMFYTTEHKVGHHTHGTSTTTRLNLPSSSPAFFFLLGNHLPVPSIPSLPSSPWLGCPASDPITATVLAVCAVDRVRNKYLITEMAEIAFMIIAIFSLTHIPSLSVSSVTVMATLGWPLHQYVYRLVSSFHTAFQFILSS